MPIHLEVEWAIGNLLQRTNPLQPAQPTTSPQEPGGLLGLIQDYMGNNLGAYR